MVYHDMLWNHMVCHVRLRCTIVYCVNHVLLWYTMTYCDILWHTLMCYGTVWYTMLLYGILWHIMMYYYMLWHAMMWYVMYDEELWYTMICYDTLWSASSRCRRMHKTRRAGCRHTVVNPGADTWPTKFPKFCATNVFTHIHRDRQSKCLRHTAVHCNAALRVGRWLFCWPLHHVFVFFSNESCYRQACLQFGVWWGACFF